MTVTYTAEVATCRKFGCFIKLLGRWRGSIYKLIWMDLILFLFLYYCINMIYLYLLDNDSKRTFESIVYYCASYTSLIPLSFVLGFYVSLVMSRWWEQYITIPWPDSIAVFVSAHVHGPDEASRVMRRTVMRYVCLCLTIVFTMISPCVKKRFPKLKHLEDAGLLLENEREIIESMDDLFPKYPKHWMPIVWAASIITRARREGHIRDDFAVKTIIDELNTFRGFCGTLMYYNFISIPLVYTQVVTIAVYSFFICSLLAHQWTEVKRDTYQALDFYSPVFITLQFFFYMGWLKVAETLINPFGEDDDDFEVNWMIDRNLQVSYLIVDEMHHEHPELVKDQYWDEVYPNELPYETDAKREQPPEPSTAKYDLEATPKRTASKIPSPSNSVVINGKPGISIQNILNQRSQRFNEAFLRFFNFTEEDVGSVKSDEENSFPSISEIENIEHITSYTPANQVEIYTEYENFGTGSVLETVVEESEEVYVDLEEQDMTNIDEDDDGQTEEQSGYESDSNSDPFEKLRLERQQKRLQRMNKYLEGYFGPNFRILSDYLKNPEPKAEYNIALVTTEDSENISILNEQEADEDGILAPVISNDFLKNDVQYNSYQEGTNLMVFENDEIMSMPTFSNAPIEKEAKSEQDLLEETLVYSDKNKCKDIIKNDVAKVDEKVDLEVLVEETTLSQVSQKSTTQDLVSIPKVGGLRSPLLQKEIGLEQYQCTPGLQSPLLQHELRLEQYHSISVLESPLLHQDSKIEQAKLDANAFLKATKVSEHSQTVETTQLPNIESNIPYSNESIIFWKSKATSPFGSARSVSTQSSSVDDREILSPGSSTITEEHRINVKNEGDEQSANN